MDPHPTPELLAKTAPAGSLADDRDDRLEQVIEAVAFATDVPVSADEVARLYTDVTGRAVTPDSVEAAADRLNAHYVEAGRALRIERWGGGYRLATTDEVAPFVTAFLARDAEKKMSRALLETLAVVAYKQPVTKPEVDHVRGVASDYALRQLLERGFVTVRGRSESVGRPLLYGTTERFLDQFGLGTLDELPSPREIEEILADPRFAGERSRMLAEWSAALPSGEAAPDPSRDTAAGAASSGSDSSPPPPGAEAPGSVSSADPPAAADG